MDLSLDTPYASDLTCYPRSSSKEVIVSQPLTHNTVKLAQGLACSPQNSGVELRPNKLRIEGIHEFLSRSFRTQLPKRHAHAINHATIHSKRPPNATFPHTFPHYTVTSFSTFFFFGTTVLTLGRNFGSNNPAYTSSAPIIIHNSNTEQHSPSTAAAMQDH
jgi:hypothetical protein